MIVGDVVVESFRMGRTKRKAASQSEPVLRNPIYNQESMNTTPGTPVSFGAIRNYKNYFKHSGVHVERALDYSAVSERLKDLIKHYSWAKLVAKKLKGFNITRVREFYAIIFEFDNDTNVTEVTMRGVTIPFEPKDINRYLGCLDVGENELYSVKWNIENKSNLKAKALECQQLLCPNGKTDKNSFTCGRADKDVRDLKHLISHNILPSWKVNQFYYKEACLILAIWKKEPVDIGRLIHKTACDFAIKMKNSNIIPYPYLIDALCEKEIVLNLEGDEHQEPHEISIGTHTKVMTYVLKEAESISRPDIPINVDIASSSNTNGNMLLEKDVEGHKGDVLLLNNNVVKLDANVTELKSMVTNLNDNVMRMTSGFIVSNENMERFRVDIIENVHHLNENVIRGYNQISVACADLNKKVGGTQNLQPSIDLIQKRQQPNKTLSQVIPVDLPIFRASTLDGLTIPYREVITGEESSKTKVGETAIQTKIKNNGGKLSTLATVAMSFSTNLNKDH